jgi:hypothetical protein
MIADAGTGLRNVLSRVRQTKSASVTTALVRARRIC